jgi:hypothetical protein
MKKIIKLTEADLTKIVKRIIREANGLPILSVLSRGLLGISLTTDPNDKSFIYLSARDPQTKAKIPDSTYKYKVSGSYDGGWAVPEIGFNLDIRNAVRYVDGSLSVEVKPRNSIVHKTLTTFAKKDFLTSDGWLKVRCSVNQLNDAINKLKSGQGKSAKVDVSQRDEKGKTIGGETNLILTLA